MGQALAVQVQGQGVVSADNLNTYYQTCDNVAALRSFIGAAADGVIVQVYMRETNTVNDGGQGIFYWNATGTAPDDNGVTTIVPNGAATGEWTRLGTSSGSSAVTGPGVSINGYIPQWNGTGGNSLSGGLPVGTTGANIVVETNPSGLLSPNILPIATASAFGAVKPDNTTILIVGGVLSAIQSMGAGPVLLTTLTASSSATLAYTSMSNAYKSYKFIFFNLIPASGANLQAQVGAGSYDSGASSYSFAGAGYTTAGGFTRINEATAAFIQLNQDNISTTASDGGISGEMTLYSPSGTTTHKYAIFQTYCNVGSGNFESMAGGGAYINAITAITQIQFFMTTGNIASGFIEVWGIP